MILSKKNIHSTLIMLSLITLFFVSNFELAEAKSKKGKKSKVVKAKYKKKRKYNATKTKEEAILMIRSNSSELSQLAGLNPIPKDQNVLANLSNHSEISDDQIEGSEVAENGNTLNSSLLSNTASDGMDSQLVGDEGEDLEELAKTDDVIIDMNQFNSLWLAYVSKNEESGEDEETDAGIAKSDIMNVIMDWLGTPYHFGGTSTSAIDCSGFMQAIFAQSAEVILPRTAQMQYDTFSKKIKNHKDLKFGDLVFFHTRKYARASHVGIYLGDGLFAHASSRCGVTVSSLESTYYSKTFIGGRRITSRDLDNMTIASSKEKAAWVH